MIKGLSVFAVFLILLVSVFLNLASVFFLWFYIPYVFWIVVCDRNTASHGGRNWLFLRNWGLLRHFRDYFKPSVICETPLNPEGLYIFGIHPHGIMTMALWVNFVAISQETSALSFRMVTLSINLWVPFFRELLLWTGFISSDKKSVLRCLKKYKRSVTITVGGAEESLMIQSNGIILDKRKGFVELALRSGASLVPVWNFGERDVYPWVYEPRRGSWLHWLQHKMKALTRCTLPIFWPFPSSSAHITTVIGTPIAVTQVKKPTADQIEVLHKTYKEALLALHSKHRETYGEPELSIKY